MKEFTILSEASRIAEATAVAHSFNWSIFIAKRLHISGLTTLRKNKYNSLVIFHMERENLSTKSRTEPPSRFTLPDPTIERTFPSSASSFSPPYSEDLVGFVLEDHLWTVRKGPHNTGPIPALDIGWICTVNLGSFYNQLRVNAVFCDYALEIGLC